MPEPRKTQTGYLITISGFVPCHPGEPASMDRQSKIWEVLSAEARKLFETAGVANPAVNRTWHQRFTEHGEAKNEGPTLNFSRARGDPDDTAAGGAQP